MQLENYKNNSTRGSKEIIFFYYEISLNLIVQ